MCTITGNSYTGGISGAFQANTPNCYSLGEYTEDDFRSGKITYLLNEGNGQ